MSHPTEVAKKCPYCPHCVAGTPWWVGQQLPIHIHYAHPEHRGKQYWPTVDTSTRVV